MPLCVAAKRRDGGSANDGAAAVNELFSGDVAESCGTVPLENAAFSPVTAAAGAGLTAADIALRLSVCSYPFLSLSFQRAELSSTPWFGPWGRRYVGLKTASRDILRMGHLQLTRLTRASV